MQDALIEFSECVREAGYDVGDLVLNQGGAGGQTGGGQNEDEEDGQAEGEGGGQGDGSGGGGQQGGRQAGFGNRNERFAQNLGLDPDDPEVQATIEDCMPIVDAGFETAGVGTPGTGTGTTQP